MKKVIWIILAILCVCGIGYIGYVIFQAKNIDSVEIAGNMQTLYVVGEDLNFGDAKLKVTYKNGNIRMVDLNEKNVTVTLFATSTEDHKTMKITYKSEVLNVDYDVIKKGFYYVSSISTSTGTSLPGTVDHTIGTSPYMIYIRGDGTLDYYYKDAGKWYMHDGVHDSSYNYKITGDTMKVELGDENFYDFKAKYNTNGSMALSCIDLTKSGTDPDIITQKKEYTYKNYETAVQTIEKVEVDYSKVATIGTNHVIEFKKGETIESSGKQLFLKVNYVDKLFLTEVYVHICDEMVSGAQGLDTSAVTSTDHAYGFYHDFDFSINYIVVNK